MHHLTETVDDHALQERPTEHVHSDVGRIEHQRAVRIGGFAELSWNFAIFQHTCATTTATHHTDQLPVGSRVEEEEEEEEEAEDEEEKEEEDEEEKGEEEERGRRMSASRKRTAQIGATKTNSTR